MTKNEIFKMVLNELNEERSRKLFECKNRKKQLYSSINGYLDLDNRLGELKIQKAKKDLKNLNTDEENTEIKQTKIAIINLLKSYNVNPSNLIPEYNCKICEDSGFVDNSICQCLNNKYVNTLSIFSETELNNHPSLENVNIELYTEKDKIAKRIETLLQNITTKEKNTILFTGETGTGKTYLAKSLLKTYILNNNYGLYIPSFNLNNELLSYHTTFDNTKNLDRFLNPDVLVIDDLGTENMFKNITQEYLLYLLNERQRLNKTTIFTTNLTVADIKLRYTDRFFSRLLDKNISIKYNFIGQDLRK